eukprot:CAMPEP_0168468778 /NCGR_PEP_ID=MMETSP0228-20121227/57878_1 /TAXON_ID=133427 /ORGANISM="Protoceratium reticulatum, Strain CCCM 535 (=CCMP 1889)" /LENGTH=53 /DNA_ID=CAMNT_0008484539 /DNA_START=91 /DNA_END=252 /DNA_ORIENTATION=-
MRQRIACIANLELGGAHVPTGATSAWHWAMAHDRMPRLLASGGGDPDYDYGQG